MKHSDFNSSIAVEIPASAAIQKIGNVAEWWGVSVTGRSEKQNDKFVVKMGGDSFFNFTVEEIAPGKRVVWLVTDCHMPWYSDKTEWTNTRLIFDFVERDGVTTVSFTHQGLTPEVECYKDCEPGWTHWIQTSLFSYLTNGKGVFRAPTK